MPWIRDILDGTSASRIAEFHASRFSRSGILQSSRLRKDVEDWLALPERRSQLSPAGLSALQSLAFAGHSGLEDHDGALVDLSREYLAFQAEDGSWHGLTDWAQELRALHLEQCDAPGEEEAPHTLPANVAWFEGLVALASRLDLGNARLTRTGEINRRHRQHLRESFFHLQKLPTEALDLCLDQSIRFLSDQDWLDDRDGLLEINEDGRRALESASTVEAAVERWWLRQAFGDDLAWWEQVSRRALAGQDAMRVWGWLEGMSQHGPALWSRLGSRLMQAVALGRLEASFHEGILLRVAAPAAPPPVPDRPLLVTADLLAYLSPMAPPRWRWILEGCALRESAGLVATYRFTREAILAAAAHPRLGQELTSLLEQAELPPPVERALRGWLESRRACRFESLRVLRVLDPSRLEELSALPAIRDLVEETVPRWGFVVAPDKEPALRRELAGLGYDPPSAETAPPPAVRWRATAAEPSPPRPSQWKLDPTSEDSRKAGVSAHSKYGEGLKELSFQDLLRVAEYAALTDSEVEVVLKGASAKAQRFRVQHVDKRHEPVKITIRASHGREDREIPLEQVRKIRICP